MCGRVENITWIVNPPHCLTQKCQKMNQFYNPQKIQLHELLPRNTTNIRLLHIEHFILPKKGHSCIHNTMSYVSSHIFGLIVVFCVYSRIDYSEKNKFILCQFLIHLDLDYHRRFELCSNWLKHCRPWYLWNLNWEQNFLPWPYLFFTTWHIEHPCFQIADHILQLSSLYNRKDYTHGKQMSSNLPCIWHDQTWFKPLGGCH